MFEVNYRDCYGDKWYLVATIKAADDYPVHRYMQSDGTWGKICNFYTGRKDLEALFEKSADPDFTLSEQDLEDRKDAREDRANRVANEDWE